MGKWRLHRSQTSTDTRCEIGPREFCPWEGGVRRVTGWWKEGHQADPPPECHAPPLAGHQGNELAMFLMSRDSYWFSIASFTHSARVVAELPLHYLWISTRSIDFVLEFRSHSLSLVRACSLFRQSARHVVRKSASKLCCYLSWVLGADRNLSDLFLVMQKSGRIQGDRCASGWRERGAGFRPVIERYYLPNRKIYGSRKLSRSEVGFAIAYRSFSVVILASSGFLPQHQFMCFGCRSLVKTSYSWVKVWKCASLTWGGTPRCAEPPEPIVAPGQNFFLRLSFSVARGIYRLACSSGTLPNGFITNNDPLAPASSTKPFTTGGKYNHSNKLMF